MPDEQENPRRKQQTPEDVGHPIGERFLQARLERKNLSQNAAAPILGIAPSTLSRIEKGRDWPDVDTVLRAARLYGRPAMWFLDPDWDDQDLKAVGGLDVLLYDLLSAYPLAQQRALAEFLPAMEDYVTKITPRA